MATNEQTYRLLWMLGLCLTMPVILLSGPLGGYLIGHYVLVEHFGFHAGTTLVLMLIGLLGSGVQAYRLVQKLRKLQGK